MEIDTFRPKLDQRNAPGVVLVPDIPDLDRTGIISGMAGAPDPPSIPR
jgi:hypothetical protein